MEYSVMAKFYDLFYQSKGYDNEVKFLTEIIKNRKLILDVGCGTGNHLNLLEQYGYICDGVDISQEMIDITKSKIKGNVYLGSMIDFKINKKYDAIISMFAVVNHLKDIDDLRLTLINLKKHLNSDGIIILDLHNPLTSGDKEEFVKNNKRVMSWEVDLKNKKEHTKIIYELENGQVVQAEHLFTIFDIKDIQEICKETKLKFVNIFSNYSFDLKEGHVKNRQIVLAKA